MKYYPYQDDVVIPPEFLGLAGFGGPCPTNVASVRINMALSSQRQWNVLCKPEAPAFATGYEHKYLDYTYNRVISENPVKVIAVIPKYKPQIGFSNVDDNPMNTIIYKDLDTQEISYIDIPKTVSVCCDFGWENISRTVNVNPGSIIPPNTKLIDSPATTDDVYKQGINCRVAPLSIGATIEDAYPISESFSKKLTKLKTQKIVIKLKTNQLPLNLFGDAENYIMIPRIGDIVRADGVVAAFRNFNSKTLLSDLLEEKLSEVNEITDRKYVSRLPGGEVYDINVYVGNKNVLMTKPYRALKEYFDKHMEYFTRVVEIYEQYKDEEFSKEMNTLITESMGKCLANNQRVNGFSNVKNVKMVISNKEPYIIVEIHIRKKVPLSVGDKISSRHGHKGICCVVVPDEKMPIDDYGFKADMCICPMSIPKRTNPGLVHELEINRTSEWIVKFMDRDFNTDEEKFQECMDLYKMIFPTVGVDVERTIRDANAIGEYLEYCRKVEHVAIVGPPSAKSLNKHLPIRLRERFKMKTSPATLGGCDRDGNIVMKRTFKDVMIGKIYVYFINKSATPASPGFGYVTKLNQPINNDHDKDVSYLRLAPYRFGEDDLRMLAAAGIASPFNRLRNLFGNSTAGVDAVVKQQLESPNPIKIRRFDIDDETLYDNNLSLQTFFNYTSASGIDIQNSLITEREALKRIAHIQKRMNTEAPKTVRRKTKDTE